MAGENEGNNYVNKINTVTRQWRSETRT